MKKLLSIILLFNCCLLGQVEYLKDGNNLSPSAFFYEIANYKSTIPGKTRVDIYVQVPYSSLSFIKNDSAFDAFYNITVTLYDEEKNNILSEKTWKETIKAVDFEQTLSRKSFNLSYKSWDIAPGKYVLKSMIEDGNSRRTAFRENKINVRSISDSLAVSDLVLISEILKDSDGGRIIPNISNTVTNRDDSLSFFYTVYSNKEQELMVEYYLNDQQKNTQTKQLDPVKVKQGANVIIGKMKKLSFALGDYSVKILVKDKNWKEITSVEKSFSSKIYGVPTSIIDLDKAVSQLIYIATSDEIEFIRAPKEYNEKMQRFIAFWEKKKPNPKVEENPILVEYYRRVDYSNKHFKGFSEGWRSDMGMIYITFGPPSQVERHPMDSNAKPYEIWYYYDMNRSFIFVDETGFNDYRLYNPDYSHWPGYRQ